MAKRDKYISWDEFFFGVAKLASERSKDPNCQVGACIVDSANRIVGVGYNGLPIGTSDDEGLWTETDDIMNKHLYVSHAEANAIMNMSSGEKCCTLYVTKFPCNECAKLIVNSRRISKVIYHDTGHSNKLKYIASRNILNSAKIPYILYDDLKNC